MLEYQYSAVIMIYNAQCAIMNKLSYCLSHLEPLYNNVCLVRCIFIIFIISVFL